MTFEEICLKVKDFLLGSPKSVYEDAGVFCLGNRTLPDTDTGDFFEVYCGETYDMAQALAKAMMGDNGSEYMVPIVRAAITCFIECASHDDVVELFARPAFKNKEAILPLLKKRFEEDFL